MDIATCYRRHISCSRGGHVPGSTESSPSRPRPRGEPLVPLLRAEEGLADPDTLATWHSALSNALSSDLPHDLLGRLALSAARRRGAARPGGAGAGRPARFRCRPASSSAARSGCSKTSSATPATARWPARRSGPAGATSGSCSRRTCGRSSTARRSDSCSTSPRSGSRRCSGGWRDSGVPRPITRRGGRASRRSWTRWPTPARTPARRSSISRSSGGRWTRCCRTITSSFCWRTRMGRAPTGWASTRRGRSGATHPLVIGREHLDLAALFGDRDDGGHRGQLPGSALASRLLHRGGAGRRGAPRRGGHAGLRAGRAGRLSPRRRHRRGSVQRGRRRVASTRRWADRGAGDDAGRGRVTGVSRRSPSPRSGSGLLDAAQMLATGTEFAETTRRVADLAARHALRSTTCTSRSG